jgi:hypothetical protein
LEELQSKYKLLLTALGSATTKEERARLQKEIDRLLLKLNHPESEMVVKDFGFTFKPGFGAEWAGYGIQPRLDAKLAYYKRYSLIAGGSRNGLDVGVSRHLDDILWGSPNNIEAFIVWKFIRMYGAQAIALGIRANF